MHKKQENALVVCQTWPCRILFTSAMGPDFYLPARYTAKFHKAAHKESTRKHKGQY
jgi:hypothetical protein